MDFPFSSVIRCFQCRNNMSIFSIPKRIFSLNKSFLFQVSQQISKPSIVEPKISEPIGKVSSVTLMTRKLSAAGGYIICTQ